jgi:hypothetical protein
VQRNSLTVHLKSHHKGLPPVYVSRWPRGRRKRGRSSSPGLENQEPETESGRRIPKEEPVQEGGENGDEQGTGEEERFFKSWRFLTFIPRLMIRIRDLVLFLTPGCGMEKNPDPG